MATQTYVTEMQSINPTTVQLQQAQKVNSLTFGQVTQSTVTANPSTPIKTQPSTSQNTTNIQPTQQQFILTIAGDSDQQVQEALQQGQVVYPTHQQYEYNQSPMYTPVTGAYYQSAGSTSQTVTQLGSIQGQIVTHQGGTYLVQPGTMDGEGHMLAHTTRASPATVTNTSNGPRSSNFDAKCWQREDQLSIPRVPDMISTADFPAARFEVQWLIDNYETAEGVSLPRSTLYNHYLRHCQEQKMDPMNPASFGKLIRSVFLGLRTRRLGTRGDSKYHYYGIRIKATSPLNQYTDDQTMAMRQQPASQGKRFKSGSVNRGDGSDSQDGSSTSAQSTESNGQHQHQQFLGDASGALPNFGCIDLEGMPLPDGLSHDHLRVFEQLYKEHSEAILDVVVNLQFSLIEALWQGFWRNSLPDQNERDFSGETNMELRLPKDRLYSMCKLEPVMQYVRRSDYAFYQALVEVLIPDVLRPIPSSLTQAIRNFAKSLEGWLKSAMVGVPDEMLKTKLAAVSAFAQTLRRYTSLNHLAQAARAVLQNTSQINQMLTDLNRVDFANVQEQASWVCQCDDGVVHQLEQDFKKTLQQQNSLEQWAVWLEGVVNQVLKTHEGSPNFPKAARQFLLKWSFYSSMVIRDLTLRSAASFGSFHLIRLLYDEYMFYLVEHKVAVATGETPIAVMGEFVDFTSMASLETVDPPAPKANTVTFSTKGLTPGLNVVSVAPASLLSMNHQGASHMSGTATNGIATIPTTSLSGNAATVTVLTSGTNAQGTKTIVVVPVSAGGGDGTPSKKLKML